MKDARDLTTSELVAEQSECERSIGEAERIGAELRARLQDVTAELARRIRPALEPRVSDHALLRFIERALGVDIDAVRDRIMSPVVRDALSAGATAVTVEGIRFVARDGVIVTAVEKPAKPRLRAGRKWEDDEDAEDAA